MPTALILYDVAKYGPGVQVNQRETADDLPHIHGPVQYFNSNLDLLFRSWPPRGRSFIFRLVHEFIHRRTYPKDLCFACLLRYWSVNWCTTKQ
jgi:hypothetical protein